MHITLLGNLFEFFFPGSYASDLYFLHPLVFWECSGGLTVLSSYSSYTSGGVFPFFFLFLEVFLGGFVTTYLVFFISSRVFLVFYPGIFQHTFIIFHSNYFRAAERTPDRAEQAFMDAIFLVWWLLSFVTLTLYCYDPPF